MQIDEPGQQDAGDPPLARQGGSVSGSQLEALISRAASGEVAAQREVFQRYKGPVYRFAKHRYRLDHEEAADATQQTFIRVFTNLRTLRNIASFEVWLWRIARRESLRITLRRERKQEPLTSVLDVACARDEALAVQQERERLISAIRVAIDTLTEGPVRDTAERYYLADPPQTTRDIAVALAVPETTVRKRLFSFRNQLRVALADELEG